MKEGGDGQIEISSGPAGSEGGAEHGREGPVVEAAPGGTALSTDETVVSVAPILESGNGMARSADWTAPSCYRMVWPLGVPVITTIQRLNSITHPYFIIRFIKQYIN